MTTIDAEPPRGWPPGKSKGGGKKMRPLAILAGVILVMVLVFGALMALTGNLGMVSVTDSQVAVKVNYMNGESDVRDTPGFMFYLPFLQEVYLLDKSPQMFVMEGDRVVDSNHVPRLSVRARDGSNFRFDDLEIHYRLIPSQAKVIISDSGAGESFKRNWIRAYARSILRDEFGRFSAEEVANPTTYGEATEEGQRRLNELLHPHGLEVIQIVTPKPSFDDLYEAAIEDRKVANQDVERLIAMEDQLLREREQKLAGVEKDKEIEMRSQQGELERLRLNAERDAIRITKSAEAYAIEQRARGEAEQAQKIARARGLTAKYSKDAEGLVAQAQALEERGEVVVREALIKKLKTIRFNLIPYSKDPAPRRLEHTDSQTARSDRNQRSAVAVEGGTQ